jgi:hypothetical protein
MPELRKQFCQDVAQALRVYNEHHEYELTDKQTTMQSRAAEQFEADGKTPDAAFVYYRSMNKLLHEISGACIDEPIGTGDIEADYERAMSTVR